MTPVPLTRDHVLLLTSIVYTRDADALAVMAGETPAPALVEPVVPEGVTGMYEGFSDVRLVTQDMLSVCYVGATGHVGMYANSGVLPGTLEYIAALSRYRAAVHAAAGRQRKLDAVKAAEEVVDRAVAAHGPLLQQEAAAFLAIKRAREALNAARKEAGL